jgi:hypothetical protein
MNTGASREVTESLPPVLQQNRSAAEGRIYRKNPDEGLAVLRQGAPCADDDYPRPLALGLLQGILGSGVEGGVCHAGVLAHGFFVTEPRGSSGLYEARWNLALGGVPQ